VHYQLCHAALLITVLVDNFSGFTKLSQFLFGQQSICTHPPLVIKTSGIKKRLKILGQFLA
jgi:hypothetical protein